MLSKSLCLKTIMIILLLTLTVWLTLRQITKSCSKPLPYEILVQKLSLLSQLKAPMKKCYKNGTLVEIDKITLDAFPNGIPKLLHSTWKTQHLPNPSWQAIEKNCKDKNEEFVFCHWDDEEIEYFVSTHKAEFFKKFLSYPYPIQKADVVRYLLLERYGGFYKDVNINCRDSFDHLMQQMSNISHSFKVLLIRVLPTGVAADFIASTPHHPFFKFTTDLLATRPQQFGLPYIDVIYGTGPMFLSKSYHIYLGNNSILPEEKTQLVFIPEKYVRENLSFISGGTWHCIDGMIIWNIYNNQRLIFIFSFILIVVVFFRLTYKRYINVRNKYNNL